MNRRVIVVGGGVSGLAAARRLVEAGGMPPIDVTLLEATGRLGGVISTLSRDGCLIEEGPDSILSDRPAAGRIAEALGITPRIVGTRDENRRSFIVRNGRLRPTPEGFYLLAPTRFLPFLTTPLLGPLGKLRAGLDLLLPARRDDGDESVGDFVTRRLGRQTLDRIAQPMIAGVYGADPFRLSLRATMPRFADMERQHGSVIRGMLAGRRRRTPRSAGREGNAASVSSGARYGLFISFDAGLQVLSDAMAASLPPGTARTDAPVTGLTIGSPGWVIGSGENAPVAADAVILALPASRAASLLRDVDPGLAGMLSSIPYGAAATVSLTFPENAIAHPLDGFGFVVPAAERFSITGCTFSHRKYPGRAPGGTALLRAFWGNASQDLDDSRIVAATLTDLRHLLAISGPPVLTHVARWPGAMPAYPVGHLETVARIEAATALIPGLELAGNAYRGIGVPDCIDSGEAAAARVLSYLSATAGRTPAASRPG